jgi:hypothetical protein
LGKAYTRREMRKLFDQFQIVEQKSFETWRPRLSGFANRILVGLGRRFGFYIVTRARKPMR